jgi:hypothetical protein
VETLATEQGVTASDAVRLLIVRAIEAQTKAAKRAARSAA